MTDCIFKNNFIVLEKILLTKLKKSFSWGIFSNFIYRIGQNESQSLTIDKNLEYLLSIESFIIATDALDDVFDGDVSLFENDKTFIIQLFKYNFRKILSNINNYEAKLIFKKNINLALKHSTDEITILSSEFFLNEMDYFKKNIATSTFLMNAIVQISLPNPINGLFVFSYFFGIANQLDNDIIGIFERGSHSDLAKFKITLPFIKAYNEAKQKNNSIYTKMRSYLLERNTYYIGDIQNYILGSGAIEYCRFIQTNCINKSFELLHQYFPMSYLEIIDFKNYIFLKE